MKDIKCVVIDIDYTLTKSDNSISDYTISIINELRNKGIYVVLCTGRPSQYAIEKSIISNASPIIISDNGSLIYNYKEDTIIYEKNIPNDILKEVWNIAIANNVDCVLNSIKTRYRHKKFFDNKYVKINSYIDSIDMLKENILQLVLNSVKKEDILKCKDYIETIRNLEITNTNLYRIPKKGYYFCDVNMAGNSKGNSIIRLINKLDISIDNVICFGDSINDISMFNICNHNVAMKNSIDELKKYANYITEYTNDEDGVAKFIEKKILKKK